MIEGSNKSMQTKDGGQCPMCRGTTKGKDGKTCQFCNGTGKKNAPTK